MLMTTLIRLLAIVAVSALATAAQAHPHVWVAFKSEVVYAPDGSVTGIRHAWAFDDMFSTFAIQGLETKQKGVYTREDLQPLAEVNVTSLKEYDFFTSSKANGRKTEFVEPKDYHLELKDSLLTLHFLLPLKTPVKTQTLDLEVYDPAYFVDFSFDDKDKEPAKLAGAPANCKVTVGKPAEMSQDMSRRLSEIPPGGQIPPGSFGEQFANKISVRCP